MGTVSSEFDEGYFGDAAVLPASELFERAEEDLVREVIVIGASSYRLGQFEDFLPLSLALFCGIDGGNGWLGRELGSRGAQPVKDQRDLTKERDGCLQNIRGTD